MADQQRIEIEIALRDSISGALKQVAKEFDSVTRKLAEGGAGAGSNIRKLGNETDKLRETSQRTAQSMTAMGGIMRGVAGGIIGTAGVVAAFVMAAGSLERFSAERVRLRAFSTDTGLAVEEVRKLRHAFQLTGMSAGDADKQIGGFAGLIQEMRVFRRESNLYQAIVAPGTQAARETGERILKLAESGNTWGALMEAVTAYERQEDEASRSYYSMITRLDKSVLQSLRRNLADVAGITNIDVSEEQVRKYLRQMVILRANLGSIWDQIAISAIDAVHKVGQELGKQGVTAESFGKKVATILSHLGPFAKIVAEKMSTFATIVKNIADGVRAIQKFFSIPDTSLPGRSKVWDDYNKKREATDKEALNTSQKIYAAIQDIGRTLTQALLPQKPEGGGTSDAAPTGSAPSTSAAPAPSGSAPPTPAAPQSSAPPLLNRFLENRREALRSGTAAQAQRFRPMPLPTPPTPASSPFMPGVGFPGGGRRSPPSAAPMPESYTPGQAGEGGMAFPEEFSGQSRSSGRIRDIIKRQIEGYVATPWHPSQMIPGSSVLRFMKRDDAAGNPSRALMRSVLGLEGDAGKEIDRSLARAIGGGADMSGTVRADIDFSDMPLASTKGGLDKGDPFVALKMEGHAQAAKASALVDYNRWTF